ncbi:MAG: hypothetical protein WC735_01805 [Candidatus Paceibacterota bacterium]|jgi:hypothetical protein
MPTIDTLEKIINTLDPVNPYEDDRMLILYCSLFIEDYVEKIYSQVKGSVKYKDCKYCGKTSKPGFLKKVKELADEGYINKEVGHDLIIEEIWKHRGPAVHEINLDVSKIIETVEKYTRDSKRDDPHGLLEKLFKNISWRKKLQMPSIAIVFTLNQTLSNILGTSTNKKLEFEIDPNCTNIRSKIISLD